MASEREEIVNYIKANGPVLPVNIAKMFRTDIMMASAMLSELVSAKHLKITKLTIGGSPVYYAPGQEAQLEEKLYHVLKGPEKEVFQMLKQKKVVLETELTPVVRIALRSLKDFSIHITVREREYEFDFWKFYLITDEEAQAMIEKKIQDLFKAEKVEEKPVQEKKIEPVHVHEEQVVIKSQSEHIQNVLKDHKPEEIKIETGKIEQEHRVTPDLIEKITERLIHELKPKLRKEKKVKEKKEEKIQIQEIKEEKKEIIEGEFYEKVSNFCKENKIEIISIIVVKKDKEFDLVVEVPSNLGSLRYFMKAKDKDKINETDVALAYSDAQVKKLPALLLSNGSMNKKAEEYATKLKGYFVFKEL